MAELDKHVSVLEAVSVAAVTFTCLLKLVTLKVRSLEQFTLKQDATSLSVLTYGECITLVMLNLHLHFRP
jgi:hypothetical protein